MSPIQDKLATLDPVLRDKLAGLYGKGISELQEILTGQEEWHPWIQQLETHGCVVINAEGKIKPKLSMLNLMAAAKYLTPKADV